MKEKISIILPVYNVENFLERCLNSILKQSYKNIELICINDGSTDHSLEILREYKEKDQRIVIIDKCNEGVSKARNVGIENATGEYIFFVDADDWLQKDALYKLYNCLKEKKVQAVRGNYVIQYINGREKSNEKINYSEINKIHIKKEILIEKLIQGEMYGYVWLLLLESKVIKNKITFTEYLPMMEDTMFYIDLILQDVDIFFLDEIVYNYSFCNDSASRNIAYCLRNYDFIIKFQEIVEKKLKEKKVYSKKMYQCCCLRVAKAVVNLINTLYKYDKTEVKKIYDEIIKNNKIFEKLCCVEIDKLNLKSRIVVSQIIKNRYNSMIFCLFIRNKMAKLKNKIRKKESF